MLSTDNLLEIAMTELVEASKTFDLEKVNEHVELAKSAISLHMNLNKEREALKKGFINE